MAPRSVRLCSFAVGWIWIGKGENWTTEFLFRCDATVFFSAKCNRLESGFKIKTVAAARCQFFIANECRSLGPPSREFTVGDFQLGMKLISPSVALFSSALSPHPLSAVGLWPGLTYLFLSARSAIADLGLAFESSSSCSSSGDLFLIFSKCDMFLPMLTSLSAIHV